MFTCSLIGCPASRSNNSDFGMHTMTVDIDILYARLHASKVSILSRNVMRYACSAQRGYFNQLFKFLFRSFNVTLGCILTMLQLSLSVL